jgi:D-threo-aldose 1-dehydrogenase
VQRTTFTTRGGKALGFTRLGFGGAPLGNMHRVLSEPEAEGVVEAAWDAGLRHFDTAPLYGHGLSEQRIGRVLKRKPRGEFVISTKVGRLLEPCAAGQEGGGIYKGVPPVRGVFDYSYDGVMRSYEASLTRLGLDRVDILYVHDIDARNHGGQAGLQARLRELIDGGGWRALDELRSASDVAAIGAGVNEWEPCARLLELADPDLFLLAGRYTLLEQAPLDGFFDACRRAGVGIVNGGPFNSGILARGPRGDGSYDYGAAPPQVIARVEALDAACRRAGTTLVAAALQFAGAHPAVACVIPGAQSVAELRSNLTALGARVPDALWDDLRERGLIHPAAPLPQAEPATC